MQIDKKSVQEAANHVAAALEHLGIDVSEENFVGTPDRFVKYLLEYLQPFDPARVLKVDFTQTHGEQGYKGMVVQSNIPFRTICPHHLLPVSGRAHVGYIPNGRVVGLSKLTRIVEAVGRELPRMQETCTDLIADILSERLEARGVVVVISADHGCMFGRGVKIHNVPTTTSSVRGLFRDVASAKEEFFDLVKLSRHR